MIARLKIIKSIVSIINLTAALRNPAWFFRHHLPYILKALYQAFIFPIHKNIFYNIRVHDGFSRNDYIKANLVIDLYRLGIIKQLEYGEDDGRGYFIGYLDDE